MPLLSDNHRPDHLRISDKIGVYKSRTPEDRQVKCIIKKGKMVFECTSYAKASEIMKYKPQTITSAIAVGRFNIKGWTLTKA